MTSEDLSFALHLKLDKVSPLVQLCVSFSTLEPLYWNEATVSDNKINLVIQLILQLFMSLKSDKHSSCNYLIYI